MHNPRLRRGSAAVWGGGLWEDMYSVPRRRTVARSAQYELRVETYGTTTMTDLMRTACFARLRGAESRMPQRPHPRAALRLPGVRERPPLRGYCGGKLLNPIACPYLTAVEHYFRAGPNPTYTAPAADACYEYAVDACVLFFSDYSPPFGGRG